MPGLTGSVRPKWYIAVKFDMIMLLERLSALPELLTESWLQNFDMYAEILEPKSLREDLQAEIEGIHKRYTSK